MKNRRLRSRTRRSITDRPTPIWRRSRGRPWSDCARLSVRIFPPLQRSQRLDRCAKWLEAKQYAAAREEYAALADSLTGPAKDEAKVGLGITDYLEGDSHAAYRYLKALSVADREANAKRLYYLTEAARQNDDDAEMMSAVKELNEHHAQSVWRLKGAGGRGQPLFFTNERDKIPPLSRRRGWVSSR